MIEEINYLGWKRNLLLRQNGVELVITLDVGPRLIRYAFVGGQNVFKEYPEQLGKSGENEWRIRGGHRFWTAPEAEHSYDIDNSPVNYETLGGDSIRIISPATKYGYQKTLQVTMDQNGSVTTEHTLKNISDKPLDITPWSLSVMTAGGTAVIPQPPYRPHPDEREPGTPLIMEDFLPNRNVTLWPYTSLCDPRFTLGNSFWQIRQDANGAATKIGLKLPNTWVGYQLDGALFLKHTPYIAEKAALYPDNGVNFELFTNKFMLELECLSPLEPLAPGATRTLVEKWQLLHKDVNWTDEKAGRDFFASLA
jgi:hypothetical protein